MRLPFIFPAVCSVVSLALTCGCDRSQQAPDSPSPGPIEIGELPELGMPRGPLDDDRIEMAPPENWIVPSRKTGWVIRFKESDTHSYPRIYVTAESYEDLIDVSASNVDEFARQISVALAEDPRVSKLTEPVTPVEIGELAGVTHGRRAKDPKKNVVVERVFIETVLAGRKYTLELQALRGTLRKYRAYLHAVAAGIRPWKAETSEPLNQDATSSEDPQER